MDQPFELSDLQTDNHEAWAWFFSEIHPVALAVTKTELRSTIPQDDEDVAMIACRETMRMVPKLNDIKHARCLAARIASSRSKDRINRYRGKEGGQKTKPIDSDESAYEVPGGDADRDLRDLEIAKITLNLLNNLKPKTRLLLVGMFLENRPYKDLAKLVGIAEGSVGVYAKRALSDLREQVARVPQLKMELNQLLGIGRMAINLLFFGII